MLAERDFRLFFTGYATSIVGAAMVPVALESRLGVGVFLKRGRKLAEVRPRSRDVSLALYLPRPADDPRLRRVLTPGGARVIHVLLLRADRRLAQGAVIT